MEVVEALQGHPNNPPKGEGMNLQGFKSESLLNFLSWPWESKNQEIIRHRNPIIKKLNRKKRETFWSKGRESAEEGGKEDKKLLGCYVYVPIPQNKCKFHVLITYTNNNVYIFLWCSYPKAL